MELSPRGHRGRVSFSVKPHESDRVLIVHRGGGVGFHLSDPIRPIDISAVYILLKSLHFDSFIPKDTHDIQIIKPLIFIFLLYQSLFIIHLCTKYCFIFFISKNNPSCPRL